MSTSKKWFISIIIPSYNERYDIINCVDSLCGQTFRLPAEIIIVDDGSKDNTIYVVEERMKGKCKFPIRLFTQTHKGPGSARNFGAEQAKGNILVFVDADMTFDKDFIKNLIKGIISGKTIGVDSQEEILANPDNYWSRCWNLGRYAAAGVNNQKYLKYMTPNRSNRGGIYRAILKSKFLKIGGFDIDGDYTDDESLARKLGKEATISKGAIFYHKNPDSAIEVWRRARWIGASRKFNTGLGMQLVNLVKFFPLMSLLKGLYIGCRFGDLRFVIFKMVYDSAVWTSVFVRLSKNI